jgi:NAD(P)-dependent dehydrogenase (short-subunit alcohol dehydrogenase family)
VNERTAKTAVITGAGSGLGRAMALAWAARGWKIGAADLDGERAEETVGMVKRAGGDGEAFLCNVRNLMEVQAMADHFFSSWGEVGLLANNAGVGDAGLVGEVLIENWERIVETNLWGVIHGCHAFIPRMKEQGRGHIVNTASAAGFCNFPEMGTYNLVKAAVISLSETLRVELAPSNIGVTVLCPAFFSSNLGDALTYTDEAQKKLLDVVFSRAKLTADEVARNMVRAVSRNKLYVVPGTDAKVLWFVKRLAPSLFIERLAKVYAREGSLMDALKHMDRKR